jgi:hypothetical protein
MLRYFVLPLMEWKNRGLEAFPNVVFQDASALTQAYAKRCYLLDYVQRKREGGPDAQRKHGGS